MLEWIQNEIHFLFYDNHHIIVWCFILRRYVLGSVSNIYKLQWIWQLYAVYDNNHSITIVIIYVKVLLDCNWFISVHLIPNHSAILCNHSEILCYHSQPIKLELKLRIASKQNKHDGRAKQSKNCLRVENLAFIFFYNEKNYLKQD